MNIYFIKPNIFYVFKNVNIFKINNTYKQSSELIIIDDFYENPNEIRKYALLQEFYITGSFPGVRTKRNYAQHEIFYKLKDLLEKCGYDSCEQKFFTGTEDSTQDSNCSFTLSTAVNKSHSWVHVDGELDDKDVVRIGAIIYLTPNAPLSGGTVFYEFIEDNAPEKVREKYTHDITKWRKTNTVSNVFNRIIIFNANKYHSINRLFGTDKYNGRLTQNIFIYCKKC
jgi:hypothetical protein